MSPGLRKVVLTAHVATSVGWLGGVAAFLALAISGLSSGDGAAVRGTYLAMDLVGWAVIVPLSFASVVTGLVQGLGTPWGLFRHYWVVIKLVISIVATIVLLIHMRPIGQAAHATLTGDDLRGVRIQLVVDAAAALVALLVATTLSIVKPRGMTRYGRRKDRGSSGA